MEVKKLFISQPMRGKTKEEILKERESVIREVEELLKEQVEVLETVFDDFGPQAKPLEYIARSIEFMAKADVVYFAKGCEGARGCKIEYQCAVEYGLTIINPQK